MLKKVFIVIAIIIIAILGVATLQPDEYRVERSTTIQAPADIVFTQINDFHKWQAWSPWAKMDPNAKFTFEGSESGVGAIHTWDGDKNIGAGKMTIIESVPHSLIRIQMDFEKPFKNIAQTEFKFDHQNDQTALTWIITGRSNFFNKIMCVVMNMDKMIGSQFEKGLTDIKAISEAAHQSTTAPATPATPDSAN